MSDMPDAPQTSGKAYDQLAATYAAQVEPTCTTPSTSGR